MTPVDSIKDVVRTLNVFFLFDVCMYIYIYIYKAMSVTLLLYKCKDLNVNKVYGEEVRWEPRKNSTCCLEEILEATPNKTAASPVGLGCRIH